MSQYSRITTYLAENYPDLDFAGDFDMMTGDTLHMYQEHDDDKESESTQLGSNVKINIMVLT